MGNFAIETYKKTWIEMILIGLVLVGAINWGTTAFGYNLVEMFSRGVNNLFKSNLPIDRVIYVIVALTAVHLAMKKTTWLPFLDRTVLPSSLIPIKKNDKTDITIKITTTPNTKVVYWASLPRGENPDVVKAYDDYSNSGVVMSDENGIAELPILTGTGYTVPTGKYIKRHVHYREMRLPYGMVGPVKTVYY